MEKTPSENENREGENYKGDYQWGLRNGGDTETGRAAGIDETRGALLPVRLHNEIDVKKTTARGRSEFLARFLAWSGATSEDIRQERPRRRRSGRQQPGRKRGIPEGGGTIRTGRRQESFRICEVKTVAYKRYHWLAQRKKPEALQKLT